MFMYNSGGEEVKTTVGLHHPIWFVQFFEDAIWPYEFRGNVRPLRGSAASEDQVKARVCIYRRYPGVHNGFGNPLEGVSSV